MEPSAWSPHPPGLTTTARDGRGRPGTRAAAPAVAGLRGPALPGLIVRGTVTGLVLVLAAWSLPASGYGPPLVNVCWDYGCDRNARLVLPATAWRDIRDLLTPRAPHPAAERARIAAAVARFEAAVGRLTPTGADRGGNANRSGLPGQQDCIDESRNTDGYLRILAERGLLAWHRVGARHKRAPWLFDVHWTAVVVQRGTGTRWAVDSWFLANGKRPYVQRLDAWRSKAPLPPNPDAPPGRRAGPRTPARTPAATANEAIPGGQRA